MNPIRALRNLAQDISAWWEYVCYGQFGEAPPSKVDAYQIISVEMPCQDCGCDIIVTARREDGDVYRTDEEPTCDFCHRRRGVNLQ